MLLRVASAVAIVGSAIALTVVAGCLSTPLPVARAESTLYAGVRGARLLDSGALVVTGGGPFDREEVFEYLQRPDGGYTLLNNITAASGAYRVQARFDLDAAWRSLSAHGVGLYDGQPVAIAMQVRGMAVAIDVHPLSGSGAGASTTSASCDPDCFVNMSPSATAMFVMTRHYDFARGGEQEFRWVGQDLDRVRTLSGGRSRLSYHGERRLRDPAGRETPIRHFSFVELLPLPDGGTFRLDFDLWTDPGHRPMGFRIRTIGGSASGILALRKGWEWLRQALAEGSAAGLGLDEVSGHG
ncbi:MAG: hypothetical protein MUF07_10660 [Steroidobacteraceae bacterium]|nr:hypothetical protein [Steroidobacteraceae bacterium]